MHICTELYKMKKVFVGKPKWLSLPIETEQASPPPDENDVQTGNTKTESVATVICKGSGDETSAKRAAHDAIHARKAAFTNRKQKADRHSAQNATSEAQSGAR